MRHRYGVFLGTLLIGLCACAQEATGPQGAAAISQVVPVAVPDAWCPVTATGPADTAAVKKHCQSTVNVSPPPLGTRDSTWHMIQGTLRRPGDSVTASRDTTQK
jgi:hypothetical protein